MMHGPGDNDLDEVQVTAKKVDTTLDPVKVTAQRIEPAMQEIVVQARRIPWWIWAGLGGLLVIVLSKGTRR